MAESNTENAFRSAFKQPDPTPYLLKLIESNPELPTIADLVFVYMDLVAESPKQIYKYAEALASVRKSTITVAGGDRLGNPAQQNIGHAFNDVFVEFHSTDLDDVNDKSVTPSNEFLVASLISAVSMLYKFCDSPAQVGGLLRGLHFDDEKNYADDVSSREILVLGACLQLLVAGSYLYGPKGTDVGRVDVLGELERIKGAGVVKDRNGQRLLAVCDNFGSIFYTTQNYSRLRCNKLNLVSRVMSVMLGASYFHKR